MNPIIRLLFDILLLRTPPSRIPYSTTLLGLLLTLHFALGLLLSLPSGPFGESVIAATTSTLMVPGLLWVVLTLTRHRPRLVQSASAMAGVEVLLMCAALPLNLWLMSGLWQTPVQMLSTLLLFWNLAVNAHILRDTLEIDWLLAAMTSLMFLFSAYMLMNLLLPAPVTGG